MTRPGPPLLPEPEPVPGPAFIGAAPTPWGRVATPKPANPHRGRGLTIWGATLSGVAVVAIVVALVVLIPAIARDPIGDFTRTSAPGPSSVTLEAGTTDVWLEYAYGDNPFGERSNVVIVAQRTGDEIDVSIPRNDVSIERGGRESVRVGRVTIPEAGVYRVSTPDEYAYAIAFGTGSDHTDAALLGLVGAILLGIGLGITGVTLLIIGLVFWVSARRRVAR